MDEHTIQTLFVAYMRKHFPNLVFFAVPNGSKRDPITAARLKREGVMPGIPDLFIAAPGANGRLGLFIEMKTEKGRPTKAQKTMLNALRSAGYEALVAYGYEHAKKILHSYLQEPPCPG
jgi:hypothetical protein